MRLSRAQERIIADLRLGLVAWVHYDRNGKPKSYLGTSNTLKQRSVLYKSIDYLIENGYLEGLDGNYPTNLSMFVLSEKGLNYKLRSCDKV